MPAKIKDITGQRFGRLTVVSRADNDKYSNACWNCICDCGNKKVVVGMDLKKGNTTSCGCYRSEKISKQKKLNLQGERFGKLTVVSLYGKTFQGGYRWNCVCDCGNKTIVSTANLRGEKVLSCGCSRVENLLGLKFGRLSVISRGKTTLDGCATWNCLCECGTQLTVRGSRLKSGETRSCGCLQKDFLKARNTVHGLLNNNTRLYRVWRSMKARCYYEKIAGYKHYGGRGIRVCDEWLHNFQAFYDWAMANGYDANAPRGKCTIDRIDVNGNYEPTNCRWITMAEQNKNKRS